jgi:hypothetical protein
VGGCVCESEEKKRMTVCEYILSATISVCT